MGAAIYAFVSRLYAEHSAAKAGYPSFQNTTTEFMSEPIATSSPAETSPSFAVMPLAVARPENPSLIPMLVQWILAFLMELGGGHVLDLLIASLFSL